MSDPEGVSPKFAKQTTDRETGASDSFYRNTGTKFDDKARDCQNEGPMEEEHTSRTR
jgi:hypothetical protein